MKINSINDIAQNYDYYIIDLVGVVYDGQAAFPKAIKTINALIAAKKTVVFLSNNPRPSQLAYDKLIEMGITNSFHIITSGDYTRDVLVKEFATRPILHIGKERNTDISSNLTLQFVETVDEADAILLTLFLEQNQDPTAYDALMAEIAKSKKPVLCANPDKHAIHGNTLRFCAGYFADRIKAFGHTPRILGKPSTGIYDYVAKLIPEIAQAKARVLMIGDTLEMDIVGARDYGIDSLLVLSGITGLEVDDDNIIDHCAINDIHPTYYADALA
jgi:HAD superfamily hydrolase (TIGR01459 family)